MAAEIFVNDTASDIPVSNGGMDYELRSRKSKSGKRAHMPAKRTDSATDRLMQTIFTRPQALTEAEIDYLNAAETGDLAEVLRALQNDHVNINLVDQLGRSALELALIGGHHLIMEHLLPRCNLQSIEDTLLLAIGKDCVKTCERILDHPLYRNQRMHLGAADAFYAKDGNTPRMRHNTTPIVLAAQRNNFYLVKLLLIRGGTILPPHDYFCDCIECSNMRVYDSVKYSRSRLNTFQALASPSYISLSSDDPILTAFQLSHQLEGLCDIEKEYKVNI